MTELDINKIASLPVKEVFEGISRIATLLTPTENRLAIRDLRLEKRKIKLCEKIYKKTEKLFKNNDGKIDDAEQKILDGLWMAIVKRGLEL